MTGQLLIMDGMTSGLRIGWHLSGSDEDVNLNGVSRLVFQMSSLEGTIGNGNGDCDGLGNGPLDGDHQGGDQDMWCFSAKEGNLGASVVTDQGKVAGLMMGGMRGGSKVAWVMPIACLRYLCEREPWFSGSTSLCVNECCACHPAST